MRLTGGCTCGAVRYEIRGEPFECGWCHCATCQSLGGTPGMVWASAQQADFSLIEGAGRVKALQLTSFAQRTFCGDCGSPLTVSYDFQPDAIDFTVCTLDDPNAVRPGHNIFWSSKPDWFEIDDGLPRHDRFRPGTAGLEGTEPPS